jgi:hypothetical protein
MNSPSSNNYIRIPIGSHEGSQKRDQEGDVEVFVQISPELNDRSLDSVRALKQDSFKRAIRAISAIADEFARGVKTAEGVGKAWVEFGLNFGFEAGELKILLVQGAADASLKVNIEWHRSEESPSDETSPTIKSRK